jgi:hypothetical protein
MGIWGGEISNGAVEQNRVPVYYHKGNAFTLNSTPPSFTFTDKTQETEDVALTFSIYEN